MAIRYSHVSTDERPSKRSNERQARSSVSCADVLGVVDRAEHAVAVDLERTAVGLDQRAEGALVSGLGLRPACRVLMNG